VKEIVEKMHKGAKPPSAKQARHEEELDKLRKQDEDKHAKLM
jgi:hypothetical protein